MTTLDIKAVQNITARKKKENKKRAIRELVGYAICVMLLAATVMMFYFG